jgi:hypothetical protein
LDFQQLLPGKTPEPVVKNLVASHHYQKSDVPSYFFFNFSGTLAVLNLSDYISFSRWLVVVVVVVVVVVDCQPCT